MVDEAMEQALATMPKCELHLHIEGTLEPDLAFAFAKRNSVALPWASIDELRAQYEFEDLQSFLDLYYALMRTLKTKDDFKDIMVAYLTRANADGVKHAEIFFDPQVHVCTNGLDFNTVLDGLLEGMAIGRERFGITGGLILSIVRDMDIDSANMILDLAQPRKNEILGIGLDSAEVGYPPDRFRRPLRAVKVLWLALLAARRRRGARGVHPRCARSAARRAHRPRHPHPGRP